MREAGLRHEMEGVREWGYAVSSRETAPDQLTVAIPILDDEGRISLAFGMRLVWSPSEEAGLDTVRAMLARSRQTLREILVDAAAEHAAHQA